MKEKVAVATVEGKAYFLIVNELREQNIPFLSLVPGEPVPAEVKVVLTTEKEKPLINHNKILVFTSENELDNLTIAVKKILQGKETYEKIIIGVDPGGVFGLAVVADGKIIERANCFTIQEVINEVKKISKSLNFSLTNVLVKIGNGVPAYKQLLEALDEALPSEVALEVVGEAGTNRPVNRHSRGIRHISSAIRIAGRAGYIYPRRRAVETNSRA